MISTIVTICARSGSKGVPGKNKLLLGNYALYQHAINQAKVLPCSTIVINTDDEEIINTLREHEEIEIINRTDNLSGDDVPKINVIKDTVNKIEVKLTHKYDYIIDIDVSNPLRKSSNLIEVQDKLINNRSNVLTVTKARKNPYYNQIEIINDTVTVVKNNSYNISGRQKAPEIFDMNASIYGWNRDTLYSSSPFFNRDTFLLEMEEWTAFDIDNKVDWIICESLFSNYKDRMNFRYLNNG
jgi:CMP-N,N'-diacetyllegionaminic acid synthase